MLAQKDASNSRRSQRRCANRCHARGWLSQDGQIGIVSAVLEDFHGDPADRDHSRNALVTRQCASHGRSESS